MHSIECSFNSGLYMYKCYMSACGSLWPRYYLMWTWCGALCHVLCFGVGVILLGFFLFLTGLIKVGLFVLKLSGSIKHGFYVFDLVSMFVPIFQCRHKSCHMQCWNGGHLIKLGLFLVMSDFSRSLFLSCTLRRLGTIIPKTLPSSLWESPGLSTYSICRSSMTEGL